MRYPEAEGETSYHLRMFQVTEEEQSSTSEVQSANVAPTGNIPPLPVDSHVGDLCHSVVGPPGEGSEAPIAAVTLSSTIGGEVGFGAGATCTLSSDVCDVRWVTLSFRRRQPLNVVTRLVTTIITNRN